MGDSKRRREEIKALKAKWSKDSTGLERHSVYHGTTETVAKLLLVGEGLKPRGDRPSNWKTLPSRSDCVYLTNFYAVKYSVEAVDSNYTVTEEVQRAAVVEMDIHKLNKASLLPDEDFLAKVHMMANNMVGAGEEAWQQLVRKYASGESHEGEISTSWHDSLLIYGTMAHWGEVPHDAITRIALIGVPLVAYIRLVEYPKAEMWAIHPNPDPETMTEQQRLHKKLTNYVFEARDKEIEVIDLNSRR